MLVIRCFYSTIHMLHSLTHLNVCLFVFLGGYGVVFLVRDGFGKKVALKRLFVNDETRLKESRSEMDILVSVLISG